MEIKVQCDCGQKFKFDVEPVDGRMPWEVNCPVCGLSGTDKANWIIAHSVPTATPPPLTPIGSVTSAPPIRVPIPTSSATPVDQPTPPTEPPKARLVINRPQANPVASAAAPPPLTTMPAPRPAARPVAESDAGPTPNFWLSLAGVVLAAILGMALWHLGYRLTGWKIGFMALITGCAAGVAPQVLGHYKGVAMGLLAAFLTLAAILGAQYLNAKHQFSKFVAQVIEIEAEGYQAAVEHAKEVVTAIPNGTEQEIRTHLAKEISDDTEVIKPEEIDAEDVADVRGQLPRLREMAAGKVSKEEYMGEVRIDDEELQGTGIVRIYLLIRALGIFNIVNIVLGVGAAYLTAKG